MNTTTIMSMKTIEVFGPNKANVTLDKDGKYQSVSQKWQGSKSNRVKIKIGQQEVPTECLDWAMIKSMIAAKIITVGAATVVKKTATEKKAEKAVKAAKIAEEKAAADLAAKAEVEDALPEVK